MDCVVAPTVDQRLIKSVIYHPEIIDSYTTEFRPDKIPTGPDIIWLACLYPELIGVMGCHVRDESVSIHPAFLPVSRGKKTAIASRLCLDWLSQNYPKKTIITETSKSNKLAQRYASAFGFVRVRETDEIYIYESTR